MPFVCVWEGGFGGQERGERRQAWTAWEVGVVVRRQAQRHTSVRATTVRRCAQSHHQHTHTHSGQGGAAHTVVVVGGNGAQWWWQPHHTQPPPPRASHALCVCDGSGQHQHSQ